jgi:hypothetical protein
MANGITEKDSEMIKVLFATFIACVTVACGGSAGWNSNLSNETLRQRVRHQACIDMGNCTDRENTEYAQATQPQQPPSAPAARQFTARPMPPQPAGFPGTMTASTGYPSMTPGFTTPGMVYTGASNESVVYGIAALDASRSDCNGQCVEFYMSSFSTPAFVEQAQGMSLSIDGNPVPISYFGTRTTVTWGDQRLATGQIIPGQIYIVPPFQTFQEKLRARMKDPGDHRADLCFYYNGAKELPIGPQGAIINTPYAHLLKCVRITATVRNRNGYAIQYGIVL